MSLHIDITGSGPPLVLLHGWAMHGGIFRPLVERLREQHTLHVVDLPGHGHSAPREGDFEAAVLLNTLFDRLPIAPWLGWSLGGLIALQAALVQPNRVTGLIPLCASPCFVRTEGWAFGVEAGVFTGFGSDLARDYRTTIDRFLALEAHGSDHMRDELRELRAHVFERGEPAAHVLQDGLLWLERGDLRARIPELAVPSLWIAGRRDRLVPWQALSWAAENAPDGRFLRIEGGGHAPFLSHADQVAEAVVAFCAG